MKQVSDLQIKLLQTYLARQMDQGMTIIKDSELDDMDKELALTSYKIGFKHAYNLINIFLEGLK